MDLFLGFKGSLSVNANIKLIIEEQEMSLWVTINWLKIVSKFGHSVFHRFYERSTQIKNYYF
jgi:hypothetical protein